MIILVLVIGMILTFVAGHQIAEKRILSSRPKVEELVESALNEPDYYNCEVSTERMFEMRLVEAEVLALEDMTMCSDVVCKNCAPSRDRIRAIRRAKQRAEADEMKGNLTHRERFENMLAAQNLPVPVTTPNESRALPRPPKGKGGGSPSPNRHTRHTTLFGREFPLPNNVPKRAEPVVIHGNKYIEINWAWQEDGRPMVIKQYVEKAIFNELPRAYTAKSYEIGAIKEFDDIEIDQLLSEPKYIHHNPLEKPRRAPRIGTETYKK